MKRNSNNKKPINRVGFFAWIILTAVIISPKLSYADSDDDIFGDEEYLNQYLEDDENTYSLENNEKGAENPLISDDGESNSWNQSALEDDNSLENHVKNQQHDPLKSSAIPQIPATPMTDEEFAKPSIAPDVPPAFQARPLPMAIKKSSPARQAQPTAQDLATIYTAEATQPPDDYIEVKDIGPEIPSIAEPNEFGGVPPIPGTRRIMAEGEAPERYVVQSGDTLYDICDQLIDEPLYWPKLWAMNPKIQNPHFIYPGVELLFYPGDHETPPYLEVVTEDDVIPIDRTNLRSNELAAMVREDLSNVLTDFGETDKTEVIGPSDLAIDLQDIFESWGRIFNPEVIPVSLPAFIYPEETNVLGSVIGGVYGKALGGAEDEMVIERKHGEVANGSIYTILRKGPKIKSQDGDYIGIRYEFISHVRILNVNSDGQYIGKITTNRLGVQPGDILTTYRSTVRTLPINDNLLPTGSSANEVIGFEFPHTNIGSRGSMVLFDKSKGDMAIGQAVAVYQDVKRMATSYLKNELPITRRRVATVYIIDRTGEAFTGYIINAKQEIRLGDRAGG